MVHERGSGRPQARAPGCGTAAAAPGTIRRPQHFRIESTHRTDRSDDQRRRRSWPRRRSSPARSRPPSPRRQEERRRRRHQSPPRSQRASTESTRFARPGSRSIPRPACCSGSRSPLWFPTPGGGAWEPGRIEVPVEASDHQLWHGHAGWPGGQKAPSEDGRRTASLVQRQPGTRLWPGSRRGFSVSSRSPASSRPSITYCDSGTGRSAGVRRFATAQPAGAETGSSRYPPFWRSRKGPDLGHGPVG